LVSSSTPLGHGCNIWLLLHPRPNGVLDFCCFRCVIEQWALAVIKLLRFFLYYINNRTVCGHGRCMQQLGSISCQMPIYCRTAHALDLAHSSVSGKQHCSRMRSSAEFRCCASGIKTKQTLVCLYPTEYLTSLTLSGLLTHNIRQLLWRHVWHGRALKQNPYETKTGTASKMQAWRYMPNDCQQAIVINWNCLRAKGPQQEILSLSSFTNLPSIDKEQVAWNKRRTTVAATVHGQVLFIFNVVLQWTSDNRILLRLSGSKCGSFVYADK